MRWRSYWQVNRQKTRRKNRRKTNYRSLSTSLQRPSQIGLAGRRTRNVCFAVYAANKNVKAWASVVGSTPSAHWVKEHLGDSPFTEVTSPRNALDLAVAGEVRAVLPTFVGDAEKDLLKVSDDIAELEHMQWLVTHHEDRHVPHVRQVIDRIHDILVAS